MKKVIGLLAGLIVLGIAGTALAGTPATNPQGDFLDLSVAATPPVSGTGQLPRGVGLTFSSFEGNRINANDLVNSNSLKVIFHDNFVDNGRKFPACTINPKALSTCSHASKIGSGTAEGMLLSPTGGAPTFVPATLSVYNGRPISGKTPTLIFIASLGGKPTLEFDFTVTRADGGLVFTELNPDSGSGPTVHLSKFTVTVPRRSETRKVAGHERKLYLIDAPTRCHRSWSYSEVLSFPNRPTLTSTDTQPCVTG